MAYNWVWPPQAAERVLIRQAVYKQHPGAGTIARDPVGVALYGVGWHL